MHQSPLSPDTTTHKTQAGLPHILTSGTIWCVSRHSGSIAWIESSGLSVDYFVSHLSTEHQPCSGDVVIGSLPLHIVASLNNRGIRFFHMQIDIPRHKRGMELSREEVASYGIHLQEYRVFQVT